MNMVYRIKIDSEAQREYKEIVESYLAIRVDLAAEFLICFDEVIDLIKQNPLLFQKRYREIHIAFTKRFPYGIHYTLKNDEIFIHAILHTSRNPKK